MSSSQGLHLKDSRDDLLEQFGRLLEDQHPRYDYRELLELAIIVLGGVPQRWRSLIKPGWVQRSGGPR